MLRSLPCRPPHLHPPPDVSHHARRRPDSPPTPLETPPSLRLGGGGTARARAGQHVWEGPRGSDDDDSLSSSDESASTPTRVAATVVTATATATSGCAHSYDEHDQRARGGERQRTVEGGSYGRYGYGYGDQRGAMTISAVRTTTMTSMSTSTRVVARVVASASAATRVAATCLGAMSARTAVCTAAVISAVRTATRVAATCLWAR